ncbi:MAG: hypothetical protein JKY56_07220 [Kofleriaceae bacterium]|nr:hypothetical protein [Kofleriaceae bacterium]
MGILWIDLSENIRTCLDALRALQYDNEHDSRMCLVLIRRETRQFRNRKTLMSQIARLLAANNKDRAIKLLKSVPQRRFRWL